MNIVGEHVFSGPREEVYRMLQDPEVLACAFPNTQSLTKIDDAHYESTINIRVGPVSGMFQGKLEVADETPPEACTLNLEGRAGRAFATGTLHLSFVEQAGGLAPCSSMLVKQKREDRWLTLGRASLIGPSRAWSSKFSKRWMRR